LAVQDIETLCRNVTALTENIKKDCHKNP
jgi:hypothetical protein